MERYKKKEEKKMFGSKNDTKKRGGFAVLAVGALAAIGALSIVRCGKQAVSGAVCKIKKLFSNDNVITLSDDDGEP